MYITMFSIITIIDGRIELQIPYNSSDIRQLKLNGWKWHGHEGRKVWSITRQLRTPYKSTELLR